MSPITLERPSEVDDLLVDNGRDLTDFDLINEDDELLIEEISIDGMCGVY